jgi:hypothetical protein
MMCPQVSLPNRLDNMRRQWLASPGFGDLAASLWIAGLEDTTGTHLLADFIHRLAVQPAGARCGDADA